MYQFQEAEYAQIPEIFALYEARIRWMDAVGLRQWNATDYLSVYPASYFESMQAKKLLYVLLHPGKEVCCAGVLLRDDPRWEDAKRIPSWYVHNLVTRCDAPGAGRIFLAEAETLAKAHGVQAMRLDCSEDNTKLNAWYEALGYIPAGSCQDGPYRGIRREKRL